MATTQLLDESTLHEFHEATRGDVLLPGDEGYDEARTVYNAMIDRRPAVVIQPTGAADVMEAVRLAREHDLLVAVKGGGHNVAGLAVCDDGLMIDLEAMSAVRVDSETRTVRAQGGAKLGDVDHETAPFGLVVPAGVVSITGLGGLALGGGFGYLCRKHGLTIDNLRAVDLVTSDAELVHVSEDAHPELFWGLRGGSGNFGVVTSFEFDAYPIEDVLAGLIVYSADEAQSVVRSWWDVIAEAPDELSVWLNFSDAQPDDPAIPEAYHGERIVSVVAIYSGETDDGSNLIAPLYEFGEPIADTVEPRPFVDWQQEFDESYPPGERYYWKSHNFSAPEPAALDLITDYAVSPVTPETRITLTHLGGAVNRRPSDATAYPHRDADFLLNISTRWEDPARDDECIEWTREYFDALLPYASGTYVNFTTDPEGEESMAYRENYERLVALKNQWDPDNLFRMNQNIKPTV